MAIVGITRSMLARQFALATAIATGSPGDHCRPFNGSDFQTNGAVVGALVPWYSPAMFVWGSSMLSDLLDIVALVPVALPVGLSVIGVLAAGIVISRRSREAKRVTATDGTGRDYYKSAAEQRPHRDDPRDIEEIKSSLINLSGSPTNHSSSAPTRSLPERVVTDKVEPSKDDILSSIRRIAGEDPNSSVAAPHPVEARPGLAAYTVEAGPAIAAAALAAAAARSMQAAKPQFSARVLARVSARDFDLSVERDSAPALALDRFCPAPPVDAAAREIASQVVSSGRLIENIPRQMTVAQKTTVEVRLGNPNAMGIGHGFAGPGELEEHLVNIVETMAVQLVADRDTFEIESTSPREQVIKRGRFKGTPYEHLGLAEFGQWIFYVTPKERGTHKLALRISAEIGGHGHATLPDRLIPVDVIVDYKKEGVALGTHAAKLAFTGSVTGLFGAIVGGVTSKYWWPPLEAWMRSMGWL